ncbi:hypothetical protein PAXRUDRAFT_551844 [Paxillus rubicundulus Ve08.2h10]|uniref:RBR-type E3 ubiquitin transferase n=1 Tax=Paxillus rubicundulus Ve08.2h10 TaxID=930991 RepID=A0A0D0DZW2_9AGAM|nr:hypothetical protein PAXRUDRAFT_551844 [Paxillus rubicundulus Ve08.2h10]
MRDETLYPPRCCRQNIPVARVRPHLSQTLVTEFQQKRAESGTLKRVYCSSPTCSRFLGPHSKGLFGRKVYTCPASDCTRKTCGSCRGEYRGVVSHVCRPDADIAQVLTLGRTAGWSRCPGCSQMIELNTGCFHVTCRCRTEFCYLCRARWKTCRCPQWGERRLLVVAEQRANAQGGVEQGNRVRRVPFVQGLRHTRTRAPPIPPPPLALPPLPLPPRRSPTLTATLGMLEWQAHMARQIRHVPPVVVPVRPRGPAADTPARPTPDRWWQAIPVPARAMQPPSPQLYASQTQTAGRSSVSYSRRAWRDAVQSSVAGAHGETQDGP